MSYQDERNMDKPAPPMTKAELRKCQKPIMEKRRRARINSCLNELKSLILEAMKKDPSRHTKLEKADILELTVKHLQSVQNQQLSMAINIKPTIVEKFKTGFADCADEVLRYVNRMEDVDGGIKQRLSNHLNNCINNLQTFGGLFNGIGSTDAAGLGAIYNRLFNETLKMAQNGTMPMNLAGTQASAPTPVTPIIIQDTNNNNNRIQMNGVQLIPSRLPSGELALVVPNSNQSNSYFTTDPNATQVNSIFDLNASRPSAFNVILKGNRSAPVSPPLSPVSTSNDTTHLQQTPLQIHINPQNILDNFPTPPNENLLLKTASQYPQISSSTTPEESPKMEVSENSGSSSESTKRSLVVDDDDDEEFSIKKRVKLERNDENNESMWRPW